MIGLQQHSKIARLLEDWDQLADLYRRVQNPGCLVVSILGTARPDFHAPAVEGAKKILQGNAQRIKADLKQLDFDVTQLPELVEWVND